MGAGQLGQAAGMFAVTNLDDLVVLAVFFGLGKPARVVLGQFLGFGAILAVSVFAALGAGLLPERVLPWLGLLPLALGLRAAWQAWRDRDADERPAVGTVGVFRVAVVCFANGGDNIGVYVPVFAVAGTAAMIGYVLVFAVGLFIWCAAGWFLTRRAPVATALSRWGHVVLPVVLVAIGLVILLGH